MRHLIAVGACLLCAPAMAQDMPSGGQLSSQEQPSNATTPVQVDRAGSSAVAVAPQAARTVPPGTLLMVTPLNEITSKRIEEGDKVEFVTVNDVVEGGTVAIRRGTPVQGTITWKTGRAIGGKSGKFEVTFNSINVGGMSYALRGSHRQEGRGNTAGALLGSMVISGRSAVMLPGQMVNIFTADPIRF